MPRIYEIPLLFLAAAGLAACSLDQVVETENIPTAGVRFINGVPDTQALDFRFVDRVENSAHWNTAFRNDPITTACVTGSVDVQYKNTRAGQRHFRIFLSDTLQERASTVVKDTTVTIDANKLYTALLWGYSTPGSSPAMRLSFIEDNAPDPGAQVALRVINTSSVAIEARHYPATGSAPATAPQEWANIPPLSVSGYVLAPAGQTRIEVRPAGGTTLLADALALPGAAGTVDFDPIPGTTQPGSAVSAIFFDPPVAGSKAPQTAAFRIGTGSTSLSATPLGFARAAGSFTTDCFFIGQEVVPSGFATAGNNAPTTVTGFIAPSNTGSITLSSTATGYLRTTGSFIDDGFQVGMPITVTGFDSAATNGRAVVTAVSATSLVVSKSPMPATEAAKSGRRIVSDQILTVANAASLTPENAGSGRAVTGERLLSFVWDRRPPRS